MCLRELLDPLVVGGSLDGYYLTIVILVILDVTSSGARIVDFETSHPWSIVGVTPVTHKNSGPGFWTSHAIASAASRAWNRLATCRRRNQMYH